MNPVDYQFFALNRHVVRVSNGKIEMVNPRTGKWFPTSELSYRTLEQDASAISEKFAEARIQQLKNREIQATTKLAQPTKVVTEIKRPFSTLTTIKVDLALSKFATFKVSFAQLGKLAVRHFKLPL